MQEGGRCGGGGDDHDNRSNASPLNDNGNGLRRKRLPLTLSKIKEKTSQWG